MAPEIPSAKITLSCPLFGADFDPRNNGFLLVGGGGGEGRSGTLLNTSRRNEISEVVDIELSRDEDSVTSLAVSKSNNKSIIALAGINSSIVEQGQDKNEHLRSFQLDYPPRQGPPSPSTSPEKPKKGTKKNVDKAAQPTTIPLSQITATFAMEGGRGSPYWCGSYRFGSARGNGGVQCLAADTRESDILGRIRLEGKDEVEDVDMLPSSEGEDGKFKVAFTDGTSIYTFKVSHLTKSNATPRTKAVYTLPFPDYFSGSKKRSKIRALRFLSPTSFLVLLNHPDRAGCELAIISIGLAPEGTVVRRTRLPRVMKIGLGLDVCPLSESAMGARQFIIAVSGNDNSIQILTLELTHKSKGTFSKFRVFATLHNVHPFSMTRLVFSTYIPPTQPVSADVRPQYVKLASISVGNTVVVHTLPLTPSAPKSRHPRYVLVQPGGSELLPTLFSGFMALIVVALGAFFLQAFTEIRGGVPPTLGAQDWLSPKLRSMIARPYFFENGLSSQYQKWRSPTDTNTHTSSILTSATSTSTIQPVRTTPTQNLRDIFSSLSSVMPEATPLPETPYESASGSIKVIVREHPNDPSLVAITTALRPPKSRDRDTNTDHGDKGVKEQLTRKWEDLHEHEREAWKEKLVAAGHWAVEEGDAILRGLFLGSLQGPWERWLGGDIRLRRTRPS
ncbi:hypothetical protein ACJ72_06261 [Emergomyces africanus]|uniref:Guanine nucleotide-exchange factor SEC12 n=1 Tax=Emergomyces africanus TaxID=1955775 RepID=A0A1B7NRL9_9EURO|nr:hypothetical protein ACJ72_06261 [Emergomyces africanus]